MFLPSSTFFLQLKIQLAFRWQFCFWACCDHPKCSACLHLSVPSTYDPWGRTKRIFRNCRKQYAAACLSGKFLDRNNHFATRPSRQIKLQRDTLKTSLNWLLDALNLQKWTTNLLHSITSYIVQLLPFTGHFTTNYFWKQTIALIKYCTFWCMRFSSKLSGKRLYQRIVKMEFLRQVSYYQQKCLRKLFQSDNERI